MIDIRNAPIKNSDTSTWPAGTWLFPSNISSFSAATASSAGAAFYPVVVPVRSHVTTLAVWLATPAAGAAIRLGLYSDNSGSPSGGQLLAETGELDCSTGTGVLKSGAINLELPPGLYWLCSNVKTSTAAFERISAVSANRGAFFPTSVESAYATGVRGYAAPSIAFGALPAVAPAVVADSVASVFPVVRMGNAG